jgi:hypothetical protein
MCFLQNLKGGLVGEQCEMWLFLFQYGLPLGFNTIWIVKVKAQHMMFTHNPKDQDPPFFPRTGKTNLTLA